MPKYVLLYETAPDAMPKIPEFFPAHQAQWERFRVNGTLLMIGPFADRQAGAPLCEGRPLFMYASA